uniref:Xylulose kinase n=1 Tax=Astyanax mexicanus TaxID=7994 RepID=A0A8B9HXR2_ASTMX
YLIGGSHCFLSLFNTGTLKVVAIDGNLQVTNQSNVQFDSDLPEFRTQGGVHIHEDRLTVTSPVHMWVKALDLILEKMKNAGFDFSNVKALSGSGQQHGSVYWRKGARQALQHLDPGRDLHSMLQGSFAVQDSPVWMDSSTTEQCQCLESAVGGAQQLADITGSRAYERFTGNQIAKIHQFQTDKYNETERISLVSSFAASLFLGDYAAIDYSDGSGMNLMDIFTKKWSQPCLNATAPQLAEKLKEPKPSTAVLGSVSPYFIERFGFPEDCKVVAFTGDNPGSLAGMRLQEGDIAVSLFLMDVHLDGLTSNLSSVMPPLLFSYKNGSLTRERIRNECAEGSWEGFSRALRSVPIGNNGNIGIYFDAMEITPPAVGVHRFDKHGRRVGRSFVYLILVIGSFMILFYFYRLCNVFTCKPYEYLNLFSSLQVLSDVFNAPVYTIDVANSACLGGAYRAMHGLVAESGVSFAEAVRKAPGAQLAVTPTTGAEEVREFIQQHSLGWLPSIENSIHLLIK